MSVSLKKIFIPLISLFLVAALFISVPPNEASAASPKIDEYITITSVVQNSDLSLTVYYNHNKSFSRGSGLTQETLQIGYDWPAQYRGSLPNYRQNVSEYVSGNDVMYIPKPDAYVGMLQIKVFYSSYTYSETKDITTKMHAPKDVKITYHEMSSTEALAEYFTIYVAPGVATEIWPTSKVVKFLGRAYLGWSIYQGAAGTLGMGFPAPQKGQYWKIEEWYDDYGDLNIRTTIWDNKASYDYGLPYRWQGYNYWNIW